MISFRKVMRILLKNTTENYKTIWKKDAHKLDKTIMMNVKNMLKK